MSRHRVQVYRQHRMWHWRCYACHYGGGSRRWDLTFAVACMHAESPDS